MVMISLVFVIIGGLHEGLSPLRHKLERGANGVKDKCGKVDAA
jgi:hypothetical protein